FDVDADFLAREMRELVAELVHFRALLADDDAGSAGVERDHHFPRLALDDDVRDRGVTQSRLEILAEQLVLFEQRRQLASGVVAGFPVLADAEPEPDWMCLLSH